MSLCVLQVKQLEYCLIPLLANEYIQRALEESSKDSPKAKIRVF